MPIVMLGIHRLVQNPKKSKLYIITLAVSILMNYYLGYMLCLFSVFYFLYILVINTTFKKHKRIYLKKIGSFLIASLLGVGLAAFDLIPIVISLKGQKSMPDRSVLSFYRNFCFRDVFSKLYTNAFDGNVSNSSMPYIYTGILAAAFLILYFFNKKIAKKERIASAVFLVLMLGFCYIHTTDVIWHAFNEPVGFAYRYAFYISFLILHIGYQGYLHYEGNRWSFLPVILIFISYSVYLILFGSKTLPRSAYILDMSILLLLGILIGIQKNYVLPFQLGFLLILCLQCADLFENAVWSLKQYESITQTEYSAYIDRVKPVVEKIKEEDTSLYRIEKNFTRNLNDSMQFSYNGLSHNSSCEKDYVKEFAANMGFRNFGIWAFYNEGSTSFTDCFLGVKYFISKYDTTNKPYTADFNTEDTYVFKNPYVLPLAFSMEEQVRDLEINQSDTNDKDPFEIQNKIAACFGSAAPVYTKAQVSDRTLENLTEEFSGEGDKGYTVYKKIDEKKEAFIEYEITAAGNDILYYYFSAPDYQGAEIYVNDFSYGDYFSNWRWNIVNAGNYQKNEKIKIRLEVKEEELKLYNSYFYEEDQNALEEWYAAAAAGAGELQEISSSHLTGTIDLDKQKYLVFSIPYEKDWVIKIDGTRIEQEEVLDALMAVKLPAGHHVIEMYYLPSGFIAGAIISIISLLIVLCMQLKLIDKE
ncbi:MAG TPA: YfhO family protein, partial [Lachnospiraceae bacterium]|nr:YfhO family protein [Lachnospiraceae bacterium]